MMRNSEQCPHGAIAKREVPKISLCNLPMDILSMILSLLPINDAVRTSVLSKKLKRVWCSHSNLTFDKGTMRKTYFRPSTGYYGVLRAKEFITKVDAVLHQHSGMGVEHMEIKFGLHSKHADHIDKWVNFAIASRTKEFVINLSGRPKSTYFGKLSCGNKRISSEEPYNLPSQLFSPSNGSYLQCLELRTVCLQLPSDFKGFLNLKSLSLVDVRITDEDVHSVLSKCNLLEFFEIAYCRMVTRIRMLHSLDRLKHLVVDICPKLQEIELNCSPTTLNTSPRLETLTLLCYEHEKTIVPEGPFKFTYLRNLRLELVISDYGKIDVLDYAYLLKIAPFMETLELPMWMVGRNRPYCKEDGELRIGLPHKHTHLKSVRISGFFGHKDQVELALHILRSSIALEKMEITPKLEISNNLALHDCCYEKPHYVDGHRIATEFVCKADYRNVVNVVKVPSSLEPSAAAMEA
ncbi:unnamed protein product [Urochloa decumbens]|uniref:F-box domain-containing protein n=2 Tax=Urochloa decumbens TaxID=240449 RepID=A0ABC8ZK48_9POAL